MLGTKKALYSHFMCKKKSLHTAIIGVSCKHYGHLKPYSYRGKFRLNLPKGGQIHRQIFLPQRVWHPNLGISGGQIPYPSPRMFCCEKAQSLAKRTT